MKSWSQQPARIVVGPIASPGSTGLVNLVCSLVLWLMIAVPCGAEDVATADAAQAGRVQAASSQPKVIPATRVEMKGLLEGLKQRKPRIPLPPADFVSPSSRAVSATGTGAGEKGRSAATLVNNGRMREYYLPASWAQPRTGGPPQPGQPAPEMNLDYAFKTRLFWIVSRVNNCHYCLGHQEHKLLAAGMTEDQIAALDSQWEEFPPADRAALEFARQLTLEPDQIGDADIEQLRLHFNDQQIVEIVFTIASNNSTNRWTDSLGIPQDNLFRDEPLKLDTPTSDRFRATRSKVAIELPRSRGPLPGAADVTRQVEAARNRSPRVAVSESPAEQPAWVRVLSAFPKTAEGQQKAWKAVAAEGKIPTELKAWIRWTSARGNRATYAIAHAWRDLQALGVPSDEVFRAEQQWTSGDSGSAEALRFVRKLTSHPQQVADDDIGRLRKHFSDHEVAEIVYVTCISNWFDRFTEALGLPVEP